MRIHLGVNFAIIFTLYGCIYLFIKFSIAAAQIAIDYFICNSILIE